MDLFGIITGPVRRMSHVHRYSSIPVHRPENVAEHSWWVAFIALLITRDLRLAGHESLDLGIVLERALVHDLDECVSGDIIRTFKYASTEMQEAVKHAAEQNMHAITSKMHPVGPAINLQWAMAKNESLAGDIVRFADMAGVVFYAREERRMGNVEMEGVVKQMYETWFKDFHDHEVLGPYADRMFPHRMFQDAFASADLGAGMTMARPMMEDHWEGNTAEHEWPMRSDVIS